MELPSSQPARVEKNRPQAASSGPMSWVESRGFGLSADQKKRGNLYHEVVRMKENLGNSKNKRFLAGSRCQFKR